MKKKSLILSLFGAVSVICAADNQQTSGNINELFSHFGNAFVETRTLNNGKIAVSPKDSGSSFHIRKGMERVCLSMGGNIYIKEVDPVGVVVDIPGFNQNMITQTSKADMKRMAEFEGPKSTTYVVDNSEYEKFYSEERVAKGSFSFMNEDKFLRAQKYDTTCSDANTGEVLYTTKTPVSGFFNFEIAFKGEMPTKAKTNYLPVEKYLSEFITFQNGDKFLLKIYGDKGWTSTAVQEYCDSTGGKLYLNNEPYQLGNKIEDKYDSMACVETQTPFVVELKNNRKEYILTKNKLPSLGGSAGNVGTAGKSDIFAQSAVLASSLPIGADSENNIGNIKTVSTVYADNGSYKLVNVREIGGNNTFKNYRVSNGSSEDITSKYVSFNTIKMPQSVLGAKAPLAKQCVLYGAANASIDGYTVSCTRQSFGSNCSANMVFMKGDQFITKESMTCN